MFDPTTLPRIMSESFFLTHAKRAVTNSGKDVPKATKIADIAYSETPIAAPILLPEKTRIEALQYSLQKTCPFK